MCPSWNDSFEGDIVSRKGSSEILLTENDDDDDDVKCCLRRSASTSVGEKNYRFSPFCALFGFFLLCLSQANNKTQADEMEIEFQTLMIRLPGEERKGVKKCKLEKC